ERAIKRGTGDSKDGGVLEEITYEGYGPHGIAMMISCVTDNRNRSVSEIRHILNRTGGTMAEAGSVSWQFNRSAYFSLPADNVDPDTAFELAVEAGADDVNFDEETIEIIGPVESFKAIGDALKGARMQIEEAELRYLPKNETELEVDETLQVLRVIEALEELDDVQDVYSTLTISDEAMAQLEAA
ncbi:MAG: YebC/PmpR family DNA-binding transcriptional regulator, partial [Anaerolineales bacterium]